MNIIQQVQEFLRSIFQWWVMITPWQQGIRVRLGKRTKLLGPGVHMKYPVIDVVYMQPIRVRAQHIGSQTITTKDKKTVSLASALQYKIDDLLRLYSTLHNAHDTIEQIIHGHIATFVRETELEEINAAALESYIADSLDLKQYGLELVRFKLTNFAAVRTYRFISGEVGQFTGYDQRLETDRVIGVTVRP